MKDYGGLILPTAALSLLVHTIQMDNSSLVYTVFCYHNYDHSFTTIHEVLVVLVELPRMRPPKN